MTNVKIQLEVAKTFLVTKEELEKAFTHVTFVKTLDENRTLWTVNEEMEKVIVSIDVLSDGSIEVLINNENEDFQVSASIDLSIEKRLEEEVQKMTVLENGVKKYSLILENDFEESQRIFDINSHTEEVDSEYAYNEREEFEGLGTYEINVGRIADYNRFIKMLNEEKEVHYNNFVDKKSKLDYKIRHKWYDDIISDERYNKLDTRLRKIQFNCKCAKCEQKMPSFEEWKNGMLEEEVFNEYTQSMKTKKAKLAKTLLKNGFSQNLIDFYSTQVKTEKTMYLTISDRVQHIAGMANYAKLKSWDGWNGTSCQDTRHHGSYSIHLAGSLHDDKLFIAMLHENLEDVENMQDKLVARAVMRYVEIDDIPHLIPAKYYGNNDTKDMLHNALNQLEEVNVHSADIKESGSWHYEDTNGFFEMNKNDEVCVYREIDENIEVDCPCCGGSGDIEVTNSMDREVSVTCPMCGGSGEYTVNVCETIEEYIEIDDNVEICPYFNNEGWEHDGHQMNIKVNYEKIRALHVKYNKALV